jgi:hypothetical protein
MGQGDPRGQHQGGMKRRFTGISERDVMKLPRRQFLHLAAAAAALPAVARVARAQSYPSPNRTSLNVFTQPAFRSSASVRALPRERRAIKMQIWRQVPRS